MELVRIKPSSRTADTILMLAAAIHFAVCVPRQYPRSVDPFWLAMAWLWIPPVILSAAYEKWCIWRVAKLCLYSLAVSFNLIFWKNRGGPAVDDPFWLGAPLWGPVVLDLMTRPVICLARSIATSSMCAECNSPVAPWQIRGQCGRAFLPEQLGQPEYTGRSAPMWCRPIVCISVAVFAGTLVFVVSYRVAMFQHAEALGIRQALADWDSGRARWYVSRAELAAMTPEARYRFNELYREVDSSTGLEIREMWPRDRWWYRTWETSYRATIQRKLIEAGSSPPTFQQPESFLRPG